MADTSRTILTVEGLSVSYGREHILQDLSFSLNEGDVLVILGPNGAGKTTLLRALLDLIPHRGTVTWQTRNLSYLPPQEFLQRQDLPPLSVEEFFHLKTRDRDAIARIFREVGLDETLLQRQFGTLSTGQFQRMLIAWALVGDPEILVLDEPTAGIDLGGEETIYTLLEQFREIKTLTILLVTHDLHVVWEYATTVLCLNRKIRCMGKPQDVITPEQLQALYQTGVKYYQHRHR
ncbi:MAG: metal ABC transporter ATP-binding protein [Methylohalobius crimeensis]